MSFNKLRTFPLEEMLFIVSFYLEWMLVFCECFSACIKMITWFLFFVY